MDRVRVTHWLNEASKKFYLVGKWQERNDKTMQLKRIEQTRTALEKAIKALDRMKKELEE